QDYDALYAAGAEAIFPPGTVISDAAEEVIHKLHARLGHTQAAASSGRVGLPPLCGNSRRRIRRLRAVGGAEAVPDTGGRKDFRRRAVEGRRGRSAVNQQMPV